MTKSTIEEILKKLTSKQVIFCHEYIIDWNASRAARKAGYSEKTAKDIACENLAKPNISAYIELIQKDIMKEAGLTKLKILLEHKKLAFSSIAHLHNTWIDRNELESLTQDQKDCISEIDTKILKKNIGNNENPEIVDVEHIKIKLYDKQKSLDAISKMGGYNEPEKHEHSGEIKSTPKIDYSNLSVSELKQLKEIMKKAQNAGTK